MTGTTSALYAFGPSFGDLVLYSFSLCNVKRTEITQQHMLDASMAANMLQSDWLNQGVNLWQVYQYEIPLFEDVADYVLDQTLLVMLDTYVVTGPIWAPVDRIILPISRTEYSSVPRKYQQGFPTTYWMERIQIPIVHLWPVPDGSQTSLRFYGLKQAQDAALTNEYVPDIPYAWINAFALGLASKLALIYAPANVQMLKIEAKEAYDRASATNVERANQYISPQISGYFR